MNDMKGLNHRIDDHRTNINNSDLLELLSTYINPYVTNILPFSSIQNESHFDIMMAQAPILIWSVDKDGTLSSSESIPCGVVGKSVFDLFAEYPNVIRAHKTVLNGIPINTQTRINQTDYNLFLTPIFDDNKVNGMIGIAINISEQLQVEDELRQSEEKYKLLFESVPLPLFVLQDGVCTIANTKFLDMYRDNDMSVTSGINYLAPEVKAKLIEGKSSAKKSGHSPISYNTLGIRKNGDKYTIHAHSSKIEHLGKPSTLVLYEDVTEKVRAEEILTENEEKYRTIFNNAISAIFVNDPETKNFYDVNKLAESQYGYTREEFLTMNFRDVAPDFPIDHLQDLLRHMDRGKRLTFESTHKRKDGSIFPVEVNPQIVPFGDRELILSFIRDITEQKQIEEEKQKLIEQIHQFQKIDAIGKLAGGIAHDLNNTLQIILGNIELARVNQTQNSIFLSQIKKASIRAKNLVKNLLAYARKTPIRRKPIQVNTIINDITNILEHTIKKTICTTTLLQEDLPQILGDKTTLHNVFMNIALNAKDAMPKGGDLTFMTDLVTLGEESVQVKTKDILPGEYIRIVITDTGIGMNEEVKSHIFEPFFTTKDPGKGVGLGLAYSYGMIKSHNGMISFESRENEGTTFSIHLPINPTEVDKIKKKSKITSKNAKHFMIIDDEKMVLDVVTKILENLGHTVTICQDSVQASHVYACIQNKVDTVLLDINMPNQDGWQVLKALKAVNPKVKVIICTGYIDEVENGKLQDESVLGFIRKPFDILELLTHIQN
ncbi:MAG: PAS domain S-box protein [Candidatus Kariarchaeaceae archaeon]|jgi:PAS domain S-box-containing protein